MYETQLSSDRPHLSSRTFHFKNALEIKAPMFRSATQKALQQDLKEIKVACENA